MNETTLCFWNSEKKTIGTSRPFTHICVYFFHLYTSVCILSISILAYCFLLQASLTGPMDDMNIPSKKEVNVRNKKQHLETGP